jgi:hypothetical protein
MNGFKQCASGHFYKDDIPSCPYCPNGQQASASSSSNMDKTVVPGGGSFEDKTQVFGGQPSSGNAATNVFGANSGAPAPGGSPRNLDRTYIAGVTDTVSADGTSNLDEAPRASRKIVGWILSYTLDPMGVDYRIYEGSNTIGKDPENTITITKDPTISGEHVNILYKHGKFYIKDKMATNGTFLNGEELEVEKAYELVDGDMLRLGKTEFKFKSYE